MCALRAKRERNEIYYDNLYFKKDNVNKPKREITENVREIIKYCENNNVKKCTKLSTFLLNLNPKTLELVEKLIEESKSFYKQNNRPKYRVYDIRKEG